MVDGDVRQVREELRELKQDVLALKIEVTDRLARIETNQAAQMAQAAQAQRAPVEREKVNDSTATQSLGKVATTLVEVTKVALQIVAAVIAALVAVRAGGAP